MNITHLEFNKLFTEHSWIANNFIDANCLTLSIEKFSKENNITKINEYLSNQYTKKSIENFILDIKRFQNMMCWENLPEIGTLFYKYFLDRLSLIQTAKKEYLKQNYVCCIPILLSLIDGVMNDINKSYGFFSDNVDLILNNSVVGDETVGKFDQISKTN
ncbi:MAG: hypothetical protein U9Q33_13090 [Campylobacterota bacterium]|nr:hypothetical protein [Campylobacterota bacterium]